MADEPEVIIACFDAGYVACGMVANWLHHVDQVGLGDQVLLVPFDSRAAAFAERSRFAFDDTYAQERPAREGITLFTEAEALKAICVKRMSTVKRHLEERRTLLFSDLDLVFLKDPFPTLRAADADFVSQSDVPPHGTLRVPRVLRRPRGRATLNAGFFYVRPNARTVCLFDPSLSDWDRFPHDQAVLHDRVVVRRGASYHLLDRDAFPNGACMARALWEKGRAALDAATIVHFNYCLGERKIELMQELGLWHPDGDWRKRDETR